MRVLVRRLDGRGKPAAERDVEDLIHVVAEIQCRAMSIGKPNVLTEEQMAEVMVKFQSYGQPGAKKTGY